MRPSRPPRGPPPSPDRSPSFLPSSDETSSFDDQSSTSIERDFLPIATISSRTGVNLGLLERYLEQKSHLSVSDGVTFLVAEALVLRMRRIISDAVSLARLRVHELTDSDKISDLPILPFALLTAEQRFVAGEKPSECPPNPEITGAFVSDVNGRPMVDLAGEVTDPDEVMTLLPEVERAKEVSLYDVIAALKGDRTVDLNKLQASKATAFLRKR